MVQMEKYIHVNGKNLRCGYTTGTCACGAALYATQILLANEYATSNRIVDALVDEVSGNVASDTSANVIVDTPAGIPVSLDIHNIEIGPDYVSCSVIKDGGDDPDVTSGMHIFARVEIAQCKDNEKEEVISEEAREQGKSIGNVHNSVIIEGGEGIGVVTKPGLDQPVGNAAINSTPRKYITEIVETVKKQFGCKETIKVTISAPEGVQIAKKTFNPRMGIEGGISIIGTTGIVEPMSNDAIVQTTKLEINQRKAKGESILYLAPGRIGESFAKEVFGIDSDDIVLCSNNIGDAFENAIINGFKEIIFIGHIGKLVKLGYGARNTHSANNDGRMEELVLCALKAGAEKNILDEIAECVTTDGAIAILENANLLESTMSVLGDRIENTLNRWVEGKANVKLCVFTNINNEPKILIKRGF